MLWQDRRKEEESLPTGSHTLAGMYRNPMPQTTFPRPRSSKTTENLINLADEIQQSPVAKMSKNAGYITLITFDACG